MCMRKQLYKNSKLQNLLISDQLITQGGEETSKEKNHTFENTGSDKGYY